MVVRATTPAVQATAFAILAAGVARGSVKVHSTTAIHANGPVIDEEFRDACAVLNADLAIQTSLVFEFGCVAIGLNEGEDDVTTCDCRA